MDNFLLFIVIASLTIASPGPGVILTISNSIKHGFSGALSGVFGIALGMLAIAIISATSLSVLLATSAVAFTALKVIGAIYLFYLGIKMWRSNSKVDIKDTAEKSNAKRFVEAFGITVLNPKPIIFFMSLLPQFVQTTANTAEFSLLAVTFSVLVVIIHCVYAAIATLSSEKLRSEKASKYIAKVSGSIFMAFGISLASTTK